MFRTVIGLLFLAITLNAQDLSTKTFSEQLSDLKLSNIKSGLLMTASRNDTLSALFYNSTFNELHKVDLASLVNPEQNMFYVTSGQAYLNMRAGFLRSKLLTTYELGDTGELIYLIVQKQYHYHDSQENACELSRILYYSDRRGVFKIEDLETKNIEDCKALKWLYLAGDFHSRL